jgi:hypothetical protein
MTQTEQPPNLPQAIELANLEDGSPGLKPISDILKNQCKFNEVGRTDTVLACRGGEYWVGCLFFIRPDSALFSHHRSGQDWWVSSPEWRIYKV